MVVENALAESHVDPASLKLEITETVVMQDAPATLETLHALKALGVQLAIDDFGTGYSSLGYLKRFPVDTLKIDRSFVQGVALDTEDTAIVRAVISVAKSLNLSVTAEGIETDAQLSRLQSLGCDRGQGYLFARPLAPEPLRLALAALPMATLAKTTASPVSPAAPPVMAPPERVEPKKIEPPRTEPPRAESPAPATPSDRPAKSAAELLQERIAELLRNRNR
jgi:predicted signal transduction protein with EAL and GGDEF domain